MKTLALGVGVFVVALFVGFFPAVAKEDSFRNHAKEDLRASGEDLTTTVMETVAAEPPETPTETAEVENTTTEGTTATVDPKLIAPGVAALILVYGDAGSRYVTMTGRCLSTDVTPDLYVSCVADSRREFRRQSEQAHDSLAKLEASATGECLRDLEEVKASIERLDAASEAGYRSYLAIVKSGYDTANFDRQLAAAHRATDEVNSGVVLLGEFRDRASEDCG